MRFLPSSAQIASKTLFTSSVGSVLSCERKERANARLLQPSSTPLPLYESNSSIDSISKSAPLSFCLATFLISDATDSALSDSFAITAMSRGAAGNRLNALNFSAPFLRAATSG